MLSEAEIDALEYVVEEGRIASMDDYGILRSLLVRVRPEWENQLYKESDEKRTNTTAMLAARGTTSDHDAAPAATAPTDASPLPGCGQVTAGMGTGDTRAWRRSNNYRRLVDAAVHYSHSDPGPRAGECMDRLCGIVDEIVGSYAAPPAGSVTLTDEEARELEAAASEYESGAEKVVYGSHAYRRRAATIRGLLARATKEGGR